MTSAQPHPAGPRRTTPRVVRSLAATLLALLVAACGGAGEKAGSTAPSSEPATATPSDNPTAGRIPLRPGEQRVTVQMPASYTPSAPTGSGTDDYRCFVLDPGVSSDQLITGFNVLPGNPEVVHHVILFRVPADLVPAAEQKDAATPGPGWTCFGSSGLGAGAGLDDAPWVGAWAPGGGEQAYRAGFGAELDAGSRVIMQVHYNLLKGTEPDRSAAELRLAPASDRITALETRLLPAPVELPCRDEFADGDLCDRSAALTDVKKRFGEGPGATADLLHFLCGEIRSGPVQSCTREIQQPETVQAVAGHMHLLGRSIKVEVNAGETDARTLLDIPVWDFDDQGSRPIKPAKLDAGDTLTVTCTHDQALRAQPSFEGQPDRYVVWGEGSTDEMCLGILLVTRP